MKIDIAKLVVHECCQTRAEVRKDVSDDYAEAYRAKAKLPPIDVFMVDGAPIIVDGFHRFAGATLAGLSFIECNVVGKGTLDEAAYHAAGVNQAHGLRRTNADKRRSVEMALRNPIGSEQSSRTIAEHCGVSDMLVADVRKEIEGGATPERRTDKAGRKQPAKKPRGVQESCTSTPKSTESHEADPPESDAKGEPSLPHEPARPETRDPMPDTAEEYRSLASAIRTAAREAHDLTDEADRQRLVGALKAVLDDTLACIPVVCPRCVGSGCLQCSTRGWCTSGHARQIEERTKRLGKGDAA